MTIENEVLIEYLYVFFPNVVLFVVVFALRAHARKVERQAKELRAIADVERRALARLGKTKS